MRPDCRPHGVLLNADWPLTQHLQVVLDADWRVLEVDLAHVVVLVAHAHVADGERDAAVARRAHVEARLVEDLEGAGGDDAVALVPRYHSRT